MEKQSVHEKIYKSKNKKVSDRDECKFNLVLRLFHMAMLNLFLMKKCNEEMF